MKKYILILLVMGSVINFSSSRRLKRLGERISSITKKEKPADRFGIDTFLKDNTKKETKKDKKEKNKNVNRFGIEEAINKKKSESSSSSSSKGNLKKTKKANLHGN